MIGKITRPTPYTVPASSGPFTILVPGYMLTRGIGCRQTITTMVPDGMEREMRLRGMRSYLNGRCTALESAQLENDSRERLSLIPMSVRHRSHVLT